MKKIISLILALVMVMSLSVTAFADGETSGSITITNTTANVEYSIYKVFDLTYSGTAVAYTYTADEEDALLADLLSDNSPFNLISIGDDQYTVTAKEEDSGAAIGAWLKERVDMLTESDSQIAAGTTVTFSSVEYGYYYVTSTLGTAVTVDSFMPNANIADKNEKPVIDKKVEGDNGALNDTSNTANIGDTVNYTVNITVKTGAENYVMHDKMTNLTFGEVTSVKIANVDVDASNYDVVTGLTDGCTFEVRFDNDYLATLAKDTVITVEYTGILTKDAVIAGAGNPNQVYLEYGNEVETDDGTVPPPTTPPDEVTTYSYEFDLVKTDANKNLLQNAEFELYNVDPTTENATPIDLVDNGNGTYRVATGTETTTTTNIVVADGKVTISGLENGTYYLVETVAPAGYNKLTTPTEFEIENGNLKATLSEGKYDKGGVQVVNQSGQALPSTGGIGTTLFYVIGSLMMACAAVLLITKKRMA